MAIGVGRRDAANWPPSDAAGKDLSLEDLSKLREKKDFKSSARSSVPLYWMRSNSVSCRQR